MHIQGIIPFAFPRRAAEGHASISGGGDGGVGGRGGGGERGAEVGGFGAKPGANGGRRGGEGSRGKSGGGMGGGGVGGDGAAGTPLVKVDGRGGSVGGGDGRGGQGGGGKGWGGDGGGGGAAGPPLVTLGGGGETSSVVGVASGLESRFDGSVGLDLEPRLAPGLWGDSVSLGRLTVDVARHSSDVLSEFRSQQTGGRGDPHRGDPHTQMLTHESRFEPRSDSGMEPRSRSDATGLESRFDSGSVAATGLEARPASEPEAVDGEARKGSRGSANRASKGGKKTKSGDTKGGQGGKAKKKKGQAVPLAAGAVMEGTGGPCAGEGVACRMVMSTALVPSDASVLVERSSAGQPAETEVGVVEGPGVEGVVAEQPLAPASFVPGGDECRAVVLFS